MRIQEEVEKNEIKPEDKLKRRGLKKSLQQLGDSARSLTDQVSLKESLQSLGDSARSLKGQLIDSLADEKLSV